MNHNKLLLLLTCVILLILTRSPALTILDGPTFTPAGTNAPLAGSLHLTTDTPSRVRVRVDDGSTNWTRDFYDFSTAHSLPLLGFKPGRTNQIEVTVFDRYRNAVTNNQPVIFLSPALPGDFPGIVLLHSEPARLEPGYTLFRVALHSETKAYEVIVDNMGQVVWYSPAVTQLDVRQLDNGDLFFSSKTNFTEMNLLGQRVRTWPVPSGYRINGHEELWTDHGTILYLSDATTVVSNYPTSTTDPNAPTTTANYVMYQQVVEISATNAALLNHWSLIDLLQPNRITYMTTLGPTLWDSEHANGLAEDPSDNSIIVSLRHQNAVVKISRGTGGLVWILGPPENWGAAWQPYLLTPTGAPFGWQYAQHAPVLSPQGTLMLYDNGNFRAQPFAQALPDSTNYSRAVEYAVNPATMEVTQVWEYGTNGAHRFYTDRVGSVGRLPQTGNVLVDFGCVKYVDGVAPGPYGPNATVARIQEVTHDPNPEVLFDLVVSEYNNPNVTFRDCYVYRTYRIPDLYAHPPLPVGDLTVTSQEGAALLEFSADPARTYTVEASSDLVHWEPIGTPTQAPGTDTYTFQDPDGAQLAPRFYRVLTL